MKNKKITRKDKIEKCKTVYNYNIEKECRDRKQKAHAMNRLFKTYTTL